MKKQKITIVILLVSILVCCLTSCRSTNSDLSSNNSSVVSTVEIDHLKIFSDKYISISKNQKEDLESLNNSKVHYEELLTAINDYPDSVADAEKEEYKNLKELVETEIDSINQKITDLTTIENSSQEVTTSEVTSTASVENSQNTTSSATQTDTATIPQETPEKVNNPYSVEDFYFPNGSTSEILYDENGRIYSLPYGTVMTLEEGYPDWNCFSVNEWKFISCVYQWKGESEKNVLESGDVIIKENGWEAYSGGISQYLTSDEDIEKWRKYGSDYLKPPNRDGSYIGEMYEITVWVWMPD